MLKCPLFCWSLVALAAFSVFTGPAWAMFEVKDPLTKMYNVESKSVYVGSISDYDADSHVLTVTPFTAYKGAAIAAEALRIEIKSPEALWSEIHVGQPIVIFQGPRSAAFHVADHWYAGQALSKANLFLINTRIGRAAHTPHDESFPGTTAELVRALDELKTGKSTLLDAFPEKLFPKAVKEKFSLPPNVTGFAAVQDKNADSPLFVVAGANGVQTFTVQTGALKETTASAKLDGLKPALVGQASIAGEDLLLLDKTFYALQNGAFKKVAALDKLPEGKILALTGGDLGDNDRPALMTLTTKDLVGIPLPPIPNIKPASTPATITQPTSPVPIINGERLAGTVLTDYHPEHKNGFGDNAALASVDLNNDHRPDLVILTPGGTLTLLNRGFGGFLVNKDDAAGLLDPAATGKPQLPLLASAPNTLWLLQKDGTVYRYDFPAR